MEFGSYYVSVCVCAGYTNGSRDQGKRETNANRLGPELFLFLQLHSAKFWSK